MGTPLAASMIRRATSFACDSMGTWLGDRLCSHRLRELRLEVRLDHPVVGGDHLPANATHSLNA